MARITAPAQEGEEERLFKGVLTHHPLKPKAALAHGKAVSAAGASEARRGATRRDRGATEGTSFSGKHSV